MEYEISVEDLLLLEEASEFEIYLYSLHEEIDIFDVSGVYNFYYEMGWHEHCKVCFEFNNIING